MGSTASSIDNIFCDDIPSAISLTGIFYCNITDHYPVFHIEQSQMNEPKALNIKKRDYSKKKNKTKFINCISKVVWSDVLWKTYGSVYLSYQYHDYKKILKRIIRVAEKDYYEKMFRENRDNIVKSWKLIRNIINNKKCNRNNDEFHIDNCKITDKTINAEKINAFYVNIGLSIASKIPPGKSDPITYIRNCVHYTILFRPVNEEEVTSILKNMKNSSAGWDSISPCIVKQTCNYFLCR